MLCAFFLIRGTLLDFFIFLFARVCVCDFFSILSFNSIQLFSMDQPFFT